VADGPKVQAIPSKPDKKSTQLTAFLETDMTSRGFKKDHSGFMITV
jgi:hypothetical protein